MNTLTAQWYTQEIDEYITIHAYDGADFGFVVERKPSTLYGRTRYLFGPITFTRRVKATDAGKLGDLPTTTVRWRVEAALEPDKTYEIHGASWSFRNRDDYVSFHDYQHTLLALVEWYARVTE